MHIASMHDHSFFSDLLPDTENMDKFDTFMTDEHFLTLEALQYFSLLKYNRSEPTNVLRSPRAFE